MAKKEVKKSQIRERLMNDAGQFLLFTKKVGKNGAIRVSATISSKGSKPHKVGRETFTTNEEANAAMTKMVKQAQKNGWNVVERKTSYVAVDKKIVIPAADAKIEMKPRPAKDEDGEDAGGEEGVDLAEDAL